MNLRILGGGLALATTLSACDRIPFLGGGSDGPIAAAEGFWEAAQAGDMDLAQTFATGSETVSLNAPDSGGPGITAVQFGDAIEEGDVATVPTTITNTMASAEPSDLAINTSLVRVDGEWKVDLDKTMDEISRGIMGVSMTDMAQAMGDAMVGAVQGMAEGMQNAAEGAVSSLAQQPAETTPVTAQTVAPPRQQVVARQSIAREEPWIPRAGTVSPGMTPEQVVQAWGEPVSDRQYGDWIYMFFRNGCESRCGTYDVVFFQGGQVVDAVVRTPAHTYTGISSSPPDNTAGFTPPAATGTIGGNG